ncbi:MAG: glycosyltransferase [Chloroflexi bacterium]|nr:glycosyltransferase [Chloroflexota bacterium]
MNILHIYKDYFPVVGGIENHVKMLAEAQVALGHDVSALVTSRDHHTHIETLNGVRVIFAARLATISSAPISIAFPRLLARERPDIAHLHFPYPLGEVANYFFGHARKTVLTYHSDIIRQKILRVFYRPLMHRVLARVDRILPTSPNYIASSPVLASFKQKCTVIPLGIDPAPFETSPLSPLPPSPSPLATPLRTWLEERGKGVPKAGMKGEAHLLFVGHLRYYKGVNYLIQAMRELPHARLRIVGSGMQEHTWKQLTRDLGIASRVEFLGNVPDAELPAHFAACDVFVLPACERSEAFGVVQLEAMAAGKPIVCTELGTGTSFVNVDGETGFVVPARDAHALASAIQKLMDDPGLRARMGAAGRVRVHAEFTRAKMVARVMNVYEGVLAT